MAEQARIFIGVDVDLNVCEKLTLVQEDLTPILRQRHGKARWVPAQNLHGTLKFIGEVERAFIPRVCDVMRRVAGATEPFSFTMSGIGMFPNPQRPRIVYGGVTEGGEVLGRLAASLDEALGELGVPRERRPFKPHITIGRIKTPGPKLDLDDVVEALAELPLGSTTVRDLVLYESQVSSRGARYEVVMRGYLRGVTPLGAARDEGEQGMS